MHFDSTNLRFFFTLVGVMAKHNQVKATFCCCVCILCYYDWTRMLHISWSVTDYFVQHLSIHILVISNFGVKIIPGPYGPKKNSISFQLCVNLLSPKCENKFLCGCINDITDLPWELIVVFLRQWKPVFGPGIADPSGKSWGGVWHQFQLLATWPYAVKAWKKKLLDNDRTREMFRVPLQ